jgi:membrane protein
MNPLRFASRMENMLGWFAASVLTATMVIYALRRGGERPARPKLQLVDPTPAQEPLDLQLARAEEPGRGRKARTPVHIPWQGWKDILFRTYNEILNDRLMAVAGGVVFYSLLSLFPAIAAGVSSYALFFDPESVAKQVAFAAGVVPSNALDMFRDEIIVSVANPKIAE